MFAKFSVKKPLTVLVAVVLVLILGFVSFTSMTPDLLPNMDFPMAILMTTYPGASPEEVEAAVTKLMWILAQTTDRAWVEELFYTPVACDILMGR